MHLKEEKKGGKLARVEEREGGRGKELKLRQDFLFFSFFGGRKTEWKEGGRNWAGEDEKMEVGESLHSREKKKLVLLVFPQKMEEGERKRGECVRIYCSPPPLSRVSKFR